MDLGLVILDMSSGAGVVDYSTLEVSDSRPGVGELFSSKADSLLDDEHNIEDWSEDCCLRFSRFLSSDQDTEYLKDMFSGVGDAKLKST